MIIIITVVGRLFEMLVYTMISDVSKKNERLARVILEHVNKYNSFLLQLCRTKCKM